jgi:hypothetical protein
MAKATNHKPRTTDAAEGGTDRQINARLAALHELCGLMVATARNGGRATAHVFGVRFTEETDALATELLAIAKREGFRTELSDAHPSTLVLSC